LLARRKMLITQNILIGTPVLTFAKISPMIVRPLRGIYIIYSE